MKGNFTADDFCKVRKFLCIGAHCDDTELRIGPVASRLMRNGAEGIQWTMIDGPWTPGLKEDCKAQELLDARSAENAKASEVMGFSKLHSFHLRAWHLYREVCEVNPFKFYFPDFSTRETLEETIGKAMYTGRPMGIFAQRLPWFQEEFVPMLEDVDPDVIFTHSMNDLHPDHYTVCSMVLRAIQASEKLRDKPVLMWRSGGNGGCMKLLPTHMIEVSRADIALTEEAMRCYPSQFTQKMMDTQSQVYAEYGKVCGKKYAVALTQMFHPQYNIHHNPAEYVADELRTDASFEVVRL